MIDGNPDRFDIAIVGGGLTGAALALALADTSYRVAVLEARPPSSPAPAWDPRVYAFSPANVDWLRGLGGWTEPLRAQPVHGMRIVGDEGGHLEFDALSAGLSELAWIAENSRLQYALWLALRRAHQVSLIEARPQSVAWGAAPGDMRGSGRHCLTLADGRRIEADLLVGADGANSWLREQAGIDIDLTDYHQSGVVANFATEKPHRGIARQWFGEDGILAYLPLPGRRISIVWSTAEAAVADRLALTPRAFADAVAEAGDHALGRLEPLTAALAFPLKRRRARQWVRPGLVLIGDAAHTVHPLAGQGVTLGFHDCRLLAEVLADRGGAARNPGEIGRLQAYAMRRMEDVMSMQATTGSLKWLFNNTDPLLRGLRNVGLGLTNRQDWLKRALLLHAVK